MVSESTARLADIIQRALCTTHLAPMPAYDKEVREFELYSRERAFVSVVAQRASDEESDNSQVKEMAAVQPIAPKKGA